MRQLRASNSSLGRRAAVYAVKCYGPSFPTHLIRQQPLRAEAFIGEDAWSRMSPTAEPAHPTSVALGERRAGQTMSPKLLSRCMVVVQMSQLKSHCPAWQCKPGTGVPSLPLAKMGALPRKHTGSAHHRCVRTASEGSKPRKQLETLQSIPEKVAQS